MWLTAVALPGSFRNPDSCEISTPGHTGNSMLCVLPDYNKPFDPAFSERGRSYIPNSHTSTRDLARNDFRLGAHLAPVHIIGLLFEQYQACLRLENVESTPGPAIER